MRRTAALLLVLPLASVPLAACDAALKAAATKPCTTETAAPASASSLPTTLPITGITVTGSTTQGSTTTYTGFQTGTDVVAVRDAINAQLKAAGLTIGRQDQEKGVEAEADFSGATTGHVRVRNLCAGYLQVQVSTSK